MEYDMQIYISYIRKLIWSTRRLW